MVRMKRLASVSFLLAAAALSTCVCFSQGPPPGSTAQQSAAPLPIKFDIVSFKLCEKGVLGTKDPIIPAAGDSILMHCQPVHHLIEFAYDGGAPYLVKGEPDWVNAETYAFQAKVAPEDVATWQKMDSPTRRRMVGAMLADTLNMKVRSETVSRPVYDLVLAKGGPKFSEHKTNPDDPPDDQKIVKGNVRWTGPETAVYTNISIDLLANGLAARLDRNVIDKTGLTGRYDVTVNPLPAAHFNPKTSSVENTDFSAIINGVKSLGLRLEPGKADTLVLNVEHIDRPPAD
jgi:uncharacterized protein (TIGR03435 family)